MNNQHYQLPTDYEKLVDLTPKDLLVYLTIKTHWFPKDPNCYPSLETLSKESGISKPTIRKSIENLKKAKYIRVEVRGRKHYYYFNPYKTFEPYTDVFLNFDLDPNIKSYLIASQKVMFKDVVGIGKISYSDSKLSELINLDRHTIAKYNNVLRERGILTIVESETRDKETGLKLNEKIFNLSDIGQAFIWTFKKHEVDISDIKEKTNKNTKEVKLLTKQVDTLSKKYEESQKEKEIYLELLKQSGLDIDKIKNIVDNTINGKIEL